MSIVEEDNNDGSNATVLRTLSETFEENFTKPVDCPGSKTTESTLLILLNTSSSGRYYF